MNINELKNKILQLAIQGKLVPQDENDIPASVLLEEIRKEKEQLIKEKKIKKEKPLPEITEEEKLFELPKGWEWVRLGDFIRFIGGNQPPKSTFKYEYIEGYIRLIQIRDYKSDSHITFIPYEKAKKFCTKDDVMIGRYGPPIFQILRGIDGAYNVALMKADPIGGIEKTYLYYLLKDSILLKKLEFLASRTCGQDGIDMYTLKAYVVGLPPREEQIRIVDKLEKLFAIIDELAENKEVMLKNISDTRNKVLQLAIQGKLVEQNPEDTPASVLLEEIRKEKEQLIKEKKIKKEKTLPEITEEEKPFKIPKGWEWVRLGEIGFYKKGPFGSTITKSMFVPKSDNTIKVYEQKNAIQKNWTLGDYYVTKEYFEAKLKGFEVFEGDIIVSCAGTIGETYIMPPGIERGVINQALMKMNIFTGINIDYFLMYFESILKSTAKESSKGSAIKNIPPFDIFKKMLFAVPPIVEQLRIVQKVDKIMAYLDELEKTILNDNII